MRIRVTVDSDACGASGSCVAIAPDAFDLSTEAYAVVRRETFGPEDLERLREAEAACPLAAISVAVEETE